MNRLTLRLIVSYALIPFLPGLFFLSVIAMNDFLAIKNGVGTAIAYEICAIVALTAWIATWFNVITWTPKRKLGTSLLAAFLLASPIPLFFDSGSWTNFYDMLALASPLIAFSAWLIGTAVLWQDRSFVLGNPVSTGTGEPATDTATKDEWFEFVRCPKCTYSMKGLHEVKCPECGWNSTIDDLFEKTAKSMSGEC